MIVKKKKIISLFLSSALIFLMAGCQGTAQSAETSGREQTEESTQASSSAETKASEMTKTAETAETKESIRKMTPWINSNVAGTVTEDDKAEIKDDFNLAVNYDYLKNTKIREGRRGEDSFAELEDSINERLINMMTDDTLEGHDAELIRKLYALWVDWDARNSLGISVLMPHIKAIEQIETIAGLTEYLTSEEGIFYGAGLSSASLSADMEDAEWYCLNIGSTALSLGDSDEYEELTSVGERSLESYRKRAKLLLKKAGYEESAIEEYLKNMYAFEKEIAPSVMSVAESHEPDALAHILNKVTVEELEELSPNYPVAEIINVMGLADSERINLTEPDWLSTLNELYTEENFEKIKSYLLVHTLVDYEKYLDEETYREVVKIKNEANGIAGIKADEELAVDEIGIFLQTSMSKVYAQNYIGKEVKDDITVIIKECIDAYRVMLEAEDWLSGETKEKALEKLDHITINAAYPDKWEDTDELQITSKEDGGSYFNALAEIVSYKLELQKKQVNTKIDREAWATDMALTDVNAYYNPYDNSINIIGGILGGSFYRADMTEEEKLAGIGSVIGHEISHAFDTMGAQFDKNGNFANWWADEDYAAFEARAQKLIDYYNTIVPFDDGENYPGSNIQGEAIADMAGVKCMLLLAKEEEGFNYDEFFRSYALLWKSIYTREFCELVVSQDSHPMNYLRVNVTLMQQPEFYETYGIKEGDGMYMAEEDRISVW